MSGYDVRPGDVLEALRELPDNSFDALLSDPPYGFAFMGKAWDYDVPSVDVWREAMRVLKPGAYLAAFGGARTFHRMAVGIEDAGFELRDCLTWLYGKGFPKSLNVGKAIDAAAGETRTQRALVSRATGSGLSAISANKDCAHCGLAVYGGDLSKACKCPKDSGAATPLAQQWDGYGTALKPAWEPIILARKPMEGTVAANVAKWGTGGLAIDACRIEGGDKPVFARSGGVVYERRVVGGLSRCNRTGETTNEGRWPANLILDEHAGEILDAQAGERPSRPSVTRNGGGNHGGSVFDKRTAAARPDSGYAETGGPSRFFFSSKVSTEERELGCSHLPLRSAGK